MTTPNSHTLPQASPDTRGMVAPSILAHRDTAQAGASESPVGRARLPKSYGGQARPSSGPYMVLALASAAALWVATAALYTAMAGLLFALWGQVQ